MMDAVQANSETKVAAGPRTFPRPESNLYKILFDPEYKQAFHNRLNRGNRYMAAFYRLRILPLFGMGKQMMRVRTVGRKSGKPRDTPIGYFRIDGTLHVFSAWGKQANWYQNIQAKPDEIWLQVGFKGFPARMEEVSELQELQATYEKFVRQDPSGAKLLMGWDPAQDKAEAADFSLMIEKVLVVRFYPK